MSVANDPGNRNCPGMERVLTLGLELRAIRQDFENCVQSFFCYEMRQVFQKFH